MLRLEWRLRRRNEIKPVQPEFLHRRLRDQQVAKVNRIKRASEKSNLLHGVQCSKFRHRLKCRSAKARYCSQS